MAKGLQMLFQTLILEKKVLNVQQNNLNWLLKSNTSLIHKFPDMKFVFIIKGRDLKNFN